jgi:hypothetical protein
MGTVLGFITARKRDTGNPCKHAVKRFQHSHLFAQPGKRSGDRKPEIPAADHRDPGRAGKFTLHPVDIGTAPHRMDALEIVSWA